MPAKKSSKKTATTKSTAKKAAKKVAKKTTTKATKEVAKKVSKKTAKKAAKKATPTAPARAIAPEGSKPAKRMPTHDEIAAEAYFCYLERMEKGLGGDESTDWETALQRLTKSI